jgi:hypothetical protein
MKTLGLIILAVVWFAAVKEEQLFVSWFTGIILFPCLIVIVKDYLDKRRI